MGTLLDGPKSRECGWFHSHETCQGFAGDYDTYTCGCPCHWCPAGLHKRGQCPGGECKAGEGT